MPSETSTSPRRSSPPGVASNTTRPLAPPKLPPLAPIDQQTNTTAASQSIPPSPVAPAFSPITPRAVPALPAISIPHPPPPQNGADTAPATMSAAQHADSGQPNPGPSPSDQRSEPAIAPTEFVPPPHPQPFSSEDSTDAIALRAAISSLQLQKKKAQEDIRTLEKVRKQALQDPGRFREELAAGRVQERKMTAGDLRAILDADSDDDDDDEDEVMNDESTKNNEDTTAGAERTENGTHGSDAAKPFPQIPGPQNVVRMPHINWDKYHVAGEPLDRMHEQQRRWPGNVAYGTDRGREFAVAAPYSPWLDTLEGGDGQERKDSAGGSFSSASGAAGGSEHPMETRRGGTRK